ncbi:exported hypothetical protein [Vibrio nigripulchritudo SO65]|uniref:PKD domain-containing protein n=1 Tax=Vibrio nigripulchritudo TaxID=28173 RepID=UPI0003B19B49|nr:PKD domain-containing protein [Vibrio nigripulchritudo]CCN33374.1 exported hypothetical protein [Vibrio nigripulchritudo AM115]CCN42915.1 exported hypothetical protein [Vibrio nigripulchritudo FTn2]CCN65443.1 exported hypothetical protein [Vibrio nigripulchritudo POn4]CCN79508.1 exported hypothetical protein [Vibrio nigripulchritudo SO65]
MKNIYLSFVSTLAILVTGCNGGETKSVDSTNTNRTPVAIAGINQQAKVGDLVTLDGTKSVDRDNDALSFQWTLVEKPENSTALLNTPNSTRPAFTADQAGNYLIDLVVNDGQIDSRKNQVKVVAVSQNENSAPTLSLTPGQRTNLRFPAHIDSGANDIDNDELFFSWEVTEKPEDSNPTLIDYGSRSQLNADIEGNYTVKVTVSDGLEVISSTSTFYFFYENVAPLAYFERPYYTFVGHQVQIDGSVSSDGNGEPLSYQWTLLSKPDSSQAVFNDPNASKPHFVADVAGTYQYSLMVNDGQLNSDPPYTGTTIALTPSDPQLRIYEHPNSQPENMPYKKAFTVDKRGSQDARHVLGRYTLTAVGADVSIQDIYAKDANEIIKPYFVGLEETKLVTLTRGQSLSFDLVAPSTNGQQTNLEFQFHWGINGPGKFTTVELFRSEYDFISN